MICYKERSTGNWEIDENNPLKEQLEKIRELCKREFEKQKNTESNDSEYEETTQVQSDSKQHNKMLVDCFQERLQAEKEEREEYDFCCKELENITKELENITIKGKNETDNNVIFNLRMKYREKQSIAKELKYKINKYETIQFKKELESYHGRLLRSDYGTLKIIDSCHIDGLISLRFETEEKQKVFDKDFKSKAEVLNYIKCYLI